MFVVFVFLVFFFFKQKTAYEMSIGDWSSDVCSSDLRTGTASALSDAAYQPSKGRSTGGRARLVRTMTASGLRRCNPPRTTKPCTNTPKAKRRRCPRSAVQPNHAATPARYSMKAVEYRRISESPYALKI